MDNPAVGVSADLNVMFDMQAQLMEILGADATPAEDLTTDHDFKQIGLYLVSEVMEVLNPTLVSTKPWKRSKPAVQRAEESREEMVDVFFFFMEWCIRAGITADQLTEAYFEKWSRNVKRAQDAGVKVDVTLVRVDPPVDTEVPPWSNKHGAV